MNNRRSQEIQGGGMQALASQELRHLRADSGQINKDGEPLTKELERLIDLNLHGPHVPFDARDGLAA